jgi:fatty aldehyde-generating acyl-ACP reductase
MNKPDFAFIVHSRDRTDLPRKFPILKFLPNIVFDFITLNLPPFVVSRITGLVTINQEESHGLLIGIPMTAHQFIEDRQRALRKIIQAINLARSKGVKYIGLGAMTASLSRGGRDVIERIADVVITTGRTYTIKNITDYIYYCLNIFHLKKEDVIVGVVGAAGGIGSGVTLMLIKSGFKKFVLIDLERKLDILNEKIDSSKEGIEIMISHQVHNVSRCDVIIAATSAPEVVIKSQDVTSGTIIINDAQPSDISPEIILNRKDVLVIEGGVLNAPHINCHFNMGLKEKNDIFSCLAETLLLTYRKSLVHYSIDNFDLNFLHEISEDGKKLGFSIKNIQNSAGYITDEFMSNFSYNVMVRHSKK